MVAALALFAAACGEDTANDASTAPASGPTPAPRAEPAAEVEPAADEGGGEDTSQAEDAGAQEEEGSEEDPGDEAGVEEPAFTEDDFEDLSAAIFDDPLNVDNRFWPLVPGTKNVYEGTALDGEEEIQRMIIFIVTDLVKVINGIQTRVIWERDFNDGELAESELAFFAQDNDGNVWHFGQYVEIWEEDTFEGGRVWVVDNPEGSYAGILMPADPTPGGGDYSVGYAPPPYNWTDRLAVGAAGVETCIEDGCFEDVLVVEETDAEFPGAFQLKYYAPDVGNVRVGWRGPDPEEEELELVEHRVLVGAELDEVRAEALALEKRAALYGTTAPIVRG